jgi:hypothetical protein
MKLKIKEVNWNKTSIISWVVVNVISLTPVKNSIGISYYLIYYKDGSDDILEKSFSNLSDIKAINSIEEIRDEKLKESGI